MMKIDEAILAPDSQLDNSIDDIDAYIATLSKEERDRLPIAAAALDLAAMVYHARRNRGLSQTAAAELTGFQQQSVSRFERGGGEPQLSTLHRYLMALGYALEFNLERPAIGNPSHRWGHAAGAENRDVGPDCPEPSARADQEHFPIAGCS